TPGEVDPEPVEALEEGGVVGAEELLEVDAVGVGSPREQELDEVRPAGVQREVQRALRLKVRVVPVAQQEEDEGVVLLLQRDLERRRSASTGTGGGLLRLERPVVGDPPLDVVEAPLAAELVELLQHVRVRRRACPRLPVARVRHRSRIYETSHTGGPLKSPKGRER